MPLREPLFLRETDHGVIAQECTNKGRALLIDFDMDYEKKYNEALERAKDFKNGIVQFALDPGESIVHYIFPELRESEGEEIYREIYSIVHHYYERKADLLVSSRNRNEMLEKWEKAKSFLEKQKEYHIPWYDYQKSKEAGYTIVPNEEYEQLIKQKEQKPVEYLDKDKVYAIMKKLHDLSFSKNILINSKEYKQIDEITHAIRLLLDYPIEQKPAEWSEEDKEMLMRCIAAIPVQGDEIMPTSYLNKLRNWLEFLPERFNPPPKQEWSETDEKMLTGIIERGSVQVPPFTTALREEQIEWLMNRLKSLRPSWKPSEEQMKTLAIFANLRCVSRREASTLESLYDDLQKLL